MKTIESTKDEEKKFELYKSILKIDNTDRNIIHQYLLLIKQIRKKTDKTENLKAEIISYIHHFPPTQFNKDFICFGEKNILQ